MLGGEITSTFDNPEKVKLGHCAKIEEVIIGEDKVCSHSIAILFFEFCLSVHYLTVSSLLAADQVQWCCTG